MFKQNTQPNLLEMEDASFGLNARIVRYEAVSDRNLKVTHEEEGAHLQVSAL